MVEKKKTNRIIKLFLLMVVFFLGLAIVRNCAASFFANCLVEQLSRLPENTDRIEVLYWGGDSSLKVIMIIKTDLTMNQLTDYYFRKLKIKPEFYWDRISPSVGNFHKNKERLVQRFEDIASSVQLIENVVSSLNGVIQRYETDSVRKDFYCISLNEY